MLKLEEEDIYAGIAKAGGSGGGTTPDDGLHWALSTITVVDSHATSGDVGGVEAEFAIGNISSLPNGTETRSIANHLGITKDPDTGDFSYDLVDDGGSYDFCVNKEGTDEYYYMFPNDMTIVDGYITSMDVNGQDEDGNTIATTITITYDDDAAVFTAGTLYKEGVEYGTGVFCLEYASWE